MKKVLLTILVLCSTIIAKADNESLTAILQHGETASVFTGINALIEAHEAAVDGDVITLSSGEFYSVAIQKSISIYGAGFESNSDNGTEVTSIIGKNGYLSIGSQTEEVKNVHLEGLRICGLYLCSLNGYGGQGQPVENVTITKCYIEGGSSVVVQNNLKDLLITKCVIAGSIVGNKDYVADNLYVANCHIGGNVQKFNYQSSVLIDHCIVMEGYYHGGYGSTDPLNYSPFVWTNCIFGMKCSEYNYAVGIGSTVRNCIVPCMDYCLNNVSGIHENNTAVDRDQMFAHFADGTYSADRTFEINLPEVWIGTDGTEIGIRGGEGWSKVPSTPVVKDLQLAVDGKTLKVTYDAQVR